jgi:hypothetical protein
MRKQPIKEKLGDLAQVLLVLLGYLIEYIWTTIVLIIKFPMRVVCKSKQEHDWVDHGSGGFSPFPGPRYRFICQRCGTRSKGDWESLMKKGFKGTAKIK